MCVLVDLFWYFIRAMPYRGLQPKSISKRRSVIKGDGGLMLFFNICGFIKNALQKFYFILQIYNVKSFKMMHFDEKSNISL